MIDKYENRKHVSKTKALYSPSANAGIESEGNVYSVLFTCKWDDSYFGIWQVAHNVRF